MSTPTFNTLIENKARPDGSSIKIVPGVTTQKSDAGIVFKVLTSYIPDVTLKLRLTQLTETEAIAIVTHLIDYRGKTFEFDLSGYRIDYSATSNPLIAAALTGIVHVEAEGDYDYAPNPGANQLHDMDITLNVVKNRII